MNDISISLLCEEDPDEVCKNMHAAEDRGEFDVPVSMFNDVVDYDTDGRAYIQDDVHYLHGPTTTEHGAYVYPADDYDNTYDTATSRFVEETGEQKDEEAAKETENKEDDDQNQNTLQENNEQTPPRPFTTCSPCTYGAVRTRTRPLVGRRTTKRTIAMINDAITEQRETDGVVLQPVDLDTLDIDDDDTFGVKIPRLIFRNL